MGMSGHASGDAVFGVTIGMTCLAGIVVLTRLFTRVRIVRDPGLDDAFIVAAILFSIATTVTMCLQVKYGMGRHMATLTPYEGMQSQKPFYVSIWVYNLSMSCTKFSILLQYLRIFPQTNFKRFCYGLMVIVAIYTCWTFFSAVFACWPIPYFWNPQAHPNGHCLPRFPVWFANAGMNIATDIATGVLPLPVLKQLELPKRQRIALMIVFGLGGFTCVISVLRLESLYTISKAKDITWQNPLAAIWSSVEINTGILCSCLPTLRGLITRLFPTLFGTHRSPYNKKPRSPHTSSSGRSGSNAQRSLGHKAKMSLEAFGRGLTGKPEMTMRSYVNGRTDSTVTEDVELRNVESNQNMDGRQIQVVTTVEQDVEKVGGRRVDGETDSVQALVRPIYGDSV